MAEASPKRFHYEFKPAPEGYGAQLDWVLGADSFTKSLAQKMQFTPADADIQQALSIARRDPEALKSIQDVWGRSVQFDAHNTHVLFGQPYSTFELGGFGVQQLKMENESSASFSPTEPIDLPNAANFVDGHYAMTHTNVVDEGKELTLGDSYSFTGAYTAEQISKKVAANLFFANKMANIPNPPFIVPVPVAIGHYPTVMNDRGEYAYFGIFMVPYNGQRTGNLQFDGRSVEALMQYGQQLIEGTPHISKVLAYIANTYGLTHNQPHPSNVFIPENKNEPIYLADFSTVYPLHEKKQEQARARELRRMVDAVWGRLRTIFVNPQEDKIISFLLQRIVEEYVGYKIPSMVPKQAVLAEPFFSALFANLVASGVIPQKLPTAESWDKIQTLERAIQNRIKKSAGQK
jgi:hypothetical protein